LEFLLAIPILGSDFWLFKPDIIYFTWLVYPFLLSSSLFHFDRYWHWTFVKWILQKEQDWRTMCILIASFIAIICKFNNFNVCLSTPLHLYFFSNLSFVRILCSSWKFNYNWYQEGDLGIVLVWRSQPPYDYWCLASANYAVPIWWY